MPKPRPTRPASGQQVPAETPAAQADLERKTRALLAAARRQGGKLTGKQRRQLLEKLGEAVLAHLEESGSPTPLPGPKDEFGHQKRMIDFINRAEPEPQGARSAAGSAAPLAGVPRAATGTRAAEGAETLDAGTETREHAKRRTRKADHSSRQGRVLQPPPEPTDTQQQERLLIRSEELRQARAEIDQLQAQAVNRLQQLLDQLAGRRGESEAANKEIARQVYDAARCAGIQLIYKGQPADIHWASRVFQLKTTDSNRTPLGSSATFPHLNARAKQHGLMAAGGTPERPRRS